MAVTINASTSAGLVQTADTTGNLSLQSNGTTIAALTSTGLAVTGAGSFTTTLGVTGAQTNSSTLQITRDNNTFGSIASTSTAASYSFWRNGTGQMDIGIDNSAGTAYVTGSAGAYGGVVSVEGAYGLTLGTNGAARLNISSAGAVTIPGTLGVTGNFTIGTTGSSGTVQNDSGNWAVKNTAGTSVGQIGTVKGWVGGVNVTDLGIASAATMNFYTGNTITVALSLSGGASPAVTIPGTLKAASYNTATGTTNTNNNTATTIYALTDSTNDVGTYQVSATIDTGSAVTAYSAWAIIVVANGGGRIVSQSDATNGFLTLSTLNVQYRQTSGGSQDVKWHVQRMF